MGACCRPDEKRDVKNLLTSARGIPSASMGYPISAGRKTVKPPAGCEGHLTRREAAIQLGLRSEFKIRQLERDGRLHAIRGRMSTAFYPEAEVLALRAELAAPPRCAPGRWTDADLIAFLRHPTASGRPRTASGSRHRSEDQHCPRRAGVPLLVQARRRPGCACDPRRTPGAQVAGPPAHPIGRRASARGAGTQRTASDSTCCRQHIRK